ncbi:MAG: T9SS type A sorting domain-containing protein [bacterium]|nr:T9SS type A sorting domain-containing protein [candidate division KSB1 bacterium]MDH7560805.1 T9SS type A sorting domain-containing protein [bacterium]
MDPYGYAADHPLYTGSGRGDYLGWLGAALGPGYEVPGVPGVYRRDFEHGAAIYSYQGGTIALDPSLRRICGVDPGNDGSLVTQITLAPRSGIILRRDENTTGVRGTFEKIPSSFNLYQNYPNPFNPTTPIRFSLPQRSHVTLKVFDVLGREVTTLVDEELSAGEHSVVFNAKDLSSGVYLCRLTAETFVQQKKMMVMR